MVGYKVAVPVAAALFSSWWPRGASKTTTHGALPRFGDLAVARDARTLICVGEGLSILTVPLPERVYTQRANLAAARQNGTRLGSHKAGRRPPSRGDRNPGSKV